MITMRNNALEFVANCLKYTAITVVTVLIGVVALKPLQNHGSRIKEMKSIVTHVYGIAAGEDHILNREEKSKLMEELHIPGALDESERLDIESYDSASTAEIYAASSYRQSRHLTNISRANLEAYITKHTREKGK